MNMVVIKSIHGKYTIRLFIKVYFTRVQYAAFDSLVKQTESHVLLKRKQSSLVKSKGGGGGGTSFLGS